MVVDGLVKSYDGTRVVDNLSMIVARGEVFALLGPNGAGKTTTVEILEGYREADDGRVEVLGLDPVKRSIELKERIGVMPQDGGLYASISPREALTLFATFYQRPHSPQEMLDLVGLSSAAETRYRRLSGGQKQRLSMALALVGRPELVFLDEPTAGLDPQARRTTWDIVAGLRRDGVTVFLTTHFLDEAERLADHVAILNRGRLAGLGTPASLIRTERPMVRLRTVSPLDMRDLACLASARSVRTEDGSYVLDTDDAPQMLVELTTMLRDRNIAAIEMRVGQNNLEEVFLHMTGREEAR